MDNLKNNQMKIHSSLSRAAMTLLVMLLSTVTAWADYQFEGEGTEESPYLIGSVYELRQFRNLSQTNSFEGIYFALTDNIQFDDTQENNFYPTIASGDVDFQGVFDGRHYSISGIRTDRSKLPDAKTADNLKQGIFASIGENGLVKNLVVENTNIRAYNQSGIIASYCAGTIQGCYIADDVVLHAMFPNGAQYGSIAGWVRYGHIDNCVSKASITLSDETGGYHSMGGLVGELQGGTITNSVFAGSLQLSSFSMNTNNFAVLGKLTNGSISNCYYTNSSLQGAYTGVTRGYTVSFAQGYIMAYGEMGEDPSDMKGVLSDGELYIGAGETVNVQAYSPYGGYFNIYKTADMSIVAGNAQGSFVMPADDVLISMGLPLYPGQQTSASVPADLSHLYSSCSVSQFVIPAAALTDMEGKYVTSVTFYTAHLSEDITIPSSVFVYLKEVNSTSINNFVSAENGTMAYQGTLSIRNDNYSMYGMLTIEFDTPYLYQGGNLLVGIDNFSGFPTGGSGVGGGGIGGGIFPKFIGKIVIDEPGQSEDPIVFFGQTVNGASITGSSNYDPDDIEATQCNFIPMTTFTYSTTVRMSPKNITAEQITTTSAALSWTGNSDAYNVSYRKLGSVQLTSKETFDSGIPEGWETQLGLLNNIMSGGNFQEWNRWHIDSPSYDFSQRVVPSFNGFDTHVLTDNSYNDHNDWLITSEYTIGEGAGLSFDLALTDYFGSIETNGTDDRFIVLLTTDNKNTWTILREWNNSGSDYVYNNISQKGENVAIDLSSYAGQTVRFAFYAESTVQNASNYIHIDNVGVGHMTPNGNWQNTSTNDAAITLTGLTPGARYEVKVQGDYGNEGVTAWTYPYTFTTAINVTLANDAVNTGIIQSLDGKAACVTLGDRTLKKNNEWNTLCLPFSLSESQIAASPLAGATIMTMQETSSFNDGVLTLNFEETDEIMAGVPYLIKWANGSDIVNPVFDGVVFNGVTYFGVTPYPMSSNDGKVYFVGQYDPFTIDSSNKNHVLMLGSGNNIGYSKNDRTLKCFRAHFEIDNNSGLLLAREIVLDFGNGETTALTLVNDEQEAVNSDAFDLQGRKIAKPTAKGVYVVNGKKVVIK